MKFNLPDIKNLYVAPVTGATLNYFINSSGNTLITDSIVFEKISISTVTLNQTRTQDTKGTYYSKSFDIVLPDITDELPEYLEQNIALLFEDCNGNWFITGHEKPYSLDKQEFEVDTENNKVSLSLSQNSYDRIQSVKQNWLDGDSILFPVGGAFNIPDDFSAVTGGSIILSWSNKEYTVQYDSFQLVRSNPVGHPSGNTSIFYINDVNSTGITQTPDYTFAGEYKYKIALSLDGLPYSYSAVKSVTAINPNIPKSLTGSTSGNNIVLTWSNTGYKQPYTGYKILRTNPVGHPSGITNTFYLNSSGQTTWTDVNVGKFSDLENLGIYKYKIAIVNSGVANQYSNESTTLIRNYNVPQNLTVVDQGNNTVLLSWTNPIYSIGVQSFVISYLRETSPGNWSGQPLVTFNNNGSATSYVLPLESTGNYRFQMAIAELPDGFQRQTFSIPLVQASFTSHATPPTLSLNNNNGTVYFGGALVTPSLHVAGGNGNVNLKYRVRNDSATVTGSWIDKTQDITVNGVDHNENLETNINAIRGGVFNVELTSYSSYNLGSPTTKTLSIPSVVGSGKVAGTSLSGGGAGSTVTINWTAYSDSNASAGYGYRVGRYLSTNFGTLVFFTVSGMGTTSYVDSTVGSLSAGTYIYYVQAISIANPIAEPAPNVYINPEYPDMININIT